MEIQAAALFAALGHASRLAIFRLLARHAPAGVAAGDIAAALGLKANTASVHLATLARAGLIEGRRDGARVLYAIHLARTGAMIDYLARDCCRGRPELCAPLSARVQNRRGEEAVMSTETTAARTFTILFVCTGNSARSIFAEAIVNRDGGTKFRAYSAGTTPNTQLNPLAVEHLAKFGHETGGLRSKHVAEFQGPDAPRLDFIFTVCDLAANEDCPPWPGQPISGHWGMPDPVKATGTEAEKKLAFSEAYRMLKHRVSAFMNLPVERLDAISLQREIDAIGASAPSQALARAAG